jgi:photosystem II stability/assembly factor-like uncharacterized protein/DNA-binding beta-propeller fold protein YncE
LGCNRRLDDNSSENKLVHVTARPQAEAVSGLRRGDCFAAKNAPWSPKGGFAPKPPPQSNDIFIFCAFASLRLCVKFCLLIVLLSFFLFTPTLAAPPPQTGSLSLPHIETIVNLGVPAGNAATPKYLALNRRAGQLYILSQGAPVLKQGNGLSLYNLASGQIDDHLKINRGDNEPLDLQFDPDTGFIYALWREQFAGAPPTLTVINSQSLQVMQDIPAVETFAVGGGEVYIAAERHVAVLNPPYASSLERRRVDLPPAASGPMAVDPPTNRLYLARNIDGNWQIEIFEADALAPLGSYPVAGTVLNILPIPNTGHFFVVTDQSGVRVLERVAATGELAGPPFELGPRFGALGVALADDGQDLYFSNGQNRPVEPGAATGPTFIGLDSGDLRPNFEIPLPTNVDEIVIDDAGKRAFALSPFDNFLYVIDLSSRLAHIVHTAVELRDVLFDPAGRQLFVSDSANRIRRLEADTFTVLAETELGVNFQTAAYSGELSLDAGRNRLYVSGWPAAVLEADTLNPVASLEPGGQLAPDPTGDNIYISHCGLTILDAATLTRATLVPGSGPRPDGLSPNPCVGYSRLDPTNHLLYSLVPNGVPGSNGGNYLYIYDLTLEPTLIFSDTEISALHIEPDPTQGRAFIGHARHNNRRLRTVTALDRSTLGQYTHQLMSVWGDARYSVAANRLYLSDSDHNRLLTLAADKLIVLGELPLPSNYNYRLAALDPAAERLFLIGLDGQLLVASPNGGPQPLLPSPPREPTGKILELQPTAAGDILARIESNYNDAFDTRLYRTADNGQTWTDLSQNLPTFPVQAIAAADDTLWAGLAIMGQSGGLYQSAAGGQRWSPAMAGLRDLWLERLYISPNFQQDGLIFAKTAYAGLHQSTDGGQSWTPLVELDPNAFFPAAAWQGTAVAFGPQGEVLVSQDLPPMRGIYKAALLPNRTLSAWELLLDRPVEALGIAPGGDVVLAYGDGLLRSTDGGHTWQAGGAGLVGVANLTPDRFFFSPQFAGDKTVYLFFKDMFGDLPARLFRSTDGGQNWQPWLDPVSDGPNFTAVAQATNGDFIFGRSDTRLTRLSPAALQWADTGRVAHRFPFSDIAASPNFANDKTLFALSSEAGLFKSTTGGRSWSQTDFPVRAHRPGPNDYRLALSPNYGQDQTLYIATGRSLHRSTDGGQSWTQLQLSTPARSFPAQKVALSPTFAADATLLAGTGGVLYRSTDGGDSWQQLLAPQESGSVTDVLAFTPEAAYARFGYATPLYVSTDGGQTWQLQPGSLGEYLSIFAATVAPDGSLIAAPEFETRLLQTSPQTPPWSIFSESLPAELAGIEAVVYGPGDNLFVGGEGGLFRSADDGQSWRPASVGLPANARVTQLYATRSHLFAALADGALFSSAANGNSWMEISVVK